MSAERTNDWCIWLEKTNLPTITTKEKKWCCPECNIEGRLVKKEDTGEGIKHCEECGSGWFILKTSRGK